MRTKTTEVPSRSPVLLPTGSSPGVTMQSAAPQAPTGQAPGQADER